MEWIDLVLRRSGVACRSGVVVCVVVVCKRAARVLLFKFKTLVL